MVVEEEEKEEEPQYVKDGVVTASAIVCLRSNCSDL